MISIGQELPTVKLLTALPKKLEPADDAFGEFSNISHPDKWKVIYLSLIHISEPTRPC